MAKQGEAVPDSLGAVAVSQNTPNNDELEPRSRRGAGSTVL